MLHERQDELTERAANSKGLCVSVPWSAWQWDGARTFEFPAGWDPRLLPMANGPGLLPQAVSRLLDAPIGAPRLEDLVRGARSVVIAIDDRTRPTPTAELLPHIIDRLVGGGISPHRMTVVIACGAHRRADEDDYAQKVGRRLMAQLSIVSHDPDAELVDTGVNLAGARVRLNRPFAEADVRIAIGAVMPHPFAGFSGGGKLVIPGLASLEVLARSHKFALMGFHGGQDLETNRFRRDMEAAVRAIGLHWTVNVVVNSSRQVIWLSAGDLVEAHRAAASMAARIGRTAAPDWPLDALLLNAYPKDGELLQIEAAFVALRSGMLEWLAPDAPVVLCAACHDGLGQHGLFGPGGHLFRTPTARSFLGKHRLIVSRLALPGRKQGAFSGRVTRSAPPGRRCSMS